MVKIILIVLFILILFFIITYNTLTKLKNKVDNSLSQIDIQLQRRFDLIPNLIETVKGYMDYEKNTLTKITELRNNFNSTKNINEKIDLDMELSSNIKNIILVSEQYPDLKANQSFINLSKELSNTENQIAYYRQFYNDIITIYNTKIQTFPNNILAKIFGFKKRDLFKITSNETKNNINVKLD